MRVENERVAREMAEWVTRRELGKLEASTSEDFESTAAFTAAKAKTYRGPSGWAAYLTDIDSAWSEMRVEVEDVLTVGSETIVSSLRIRALPRGGGPPIDEKAFNVAQFRDGKALRSCTYPHRPEALRAAGVFE
jgi:ketosteroid isomerase-like protein